MERRDRKMGRKNMVIKGWRKEREDVKRVVDEINGKLEMVRKMEKKTK